MAMDIAGTGHGFRERVLETNCAGCDVVQCTVPIFFISQNNQHI